MIPRVTDKPENRDVATLSLFCLCLWPFVPKIMYHLKAASAVPRIGMYRPFLSLVSREQPATAVTIITGCLFYWSPLLWCHSCDNNYRVPFFIGPPFYNASAVTIMMILIERKKSKKSSWSNLGIPKKMCCMLTQNKLVTELPGVQKEFVLKMWTVWLWETIWSFL